MIVVKLTVSQHWLPLAGDSHSLDSAPGHADVPLQTSLVPATHQPYVNTVTQQASTLLLLLLTRDM